MKSSCFSTRHHWPRTSVRMFATHINSAHWLSLLQKHTCWHKKNFSWKKQKLILGYYHGILNRHKMFRDVEWMTGLSVAQINVFENVVKASWSVHTNLLWKYKLERNTKSNESDCWGIIDVAVGQLYRLVPITITIVIIIIVIIIVIIIPCPSKKFECIDM